MNLTDELHVVLGTGPVGLATMEALLKRGKSVRVVNRSGRDGFVVVSPEHHEGMSPGMQDFWRALPSRPQAMLAVFDYLDEQVQAGGALAGLLDPQLVAVVGHSYGGYATLAAGGARIDFGSFKRLCEETTEAPKNGPHARQELVGS